MKALPSCLELHEYRSKELLLGDLCEFRAWASRKVETRRREGSQAWGAAEAVLYAGGRSAPAPRTPWETVDFNCSKQPRSEARTRPLDESHTKSIEQGPSP